MNYKNFEHETLYNEDIKLLTYYLVSLFYKTDCKYWCSRTKINRLLTIYKFCTIKYKSDVLKGEYVISNPKNKIGIWFPKLNGYIDRDVYLKYNIMEDNCEKIIEQFNENAEIPKIFEVEKEISVISKILLEKIFREFGNYPLNVLAPMVDEVILKMPIKEIEGKTEIDTNNFENFLNTNTNNEVFNFIKEYRKDMPLTKKEKVKVKKIVKQVKK